LIDLWIVNPDIIFPVLLFHVMDSQLVKGCQFSFDGYLTNNPTTRPGIDLQGGPSLEKKSVFSWLEKTLIFLARKNCREDNGWSGL
jgi:hypothetical protein